MSLTNRALINRASYLRKKVNNKFFTFTLDYEMFEELREVAKSDNTSIAETIRLYVAWGLENHSIEERRRR